MNRNEEFFELLNDLEKNAPDLSPSVRKAKERRSRWKKGQNNIKLNNRRE